MNIKNFLLKNLGLRILAMVLALFVWAMITGRERSFSEKTLDVIVEYYGVAKTINIRSVNPDKVRVKIQGTSNILEKITADNIKIRIDLKRLSETSRISVFTEDNLVLPPQVNVVSIHPRMIEITAEELYTHEVPVKVKYTGKLNPALKLVSKQVFPEKVKIIGYKTQIGNIQSVETADAIDLSSVQSTQTFSLRLKKEKEIIKFLNGDSIEVTLVIDYANNNNNNKLEIMDKK